FSEEALSTNEQKEIEDRAIQDVEDEIKRVEDKITQTEEGRKEFQDLKNKVRSDLEGARPREMLPAEEKRYQAELDAQSDLIARISTVEAERRRQLGEEVSPLQYYESQRIRWQREISPRLQAEDATFFQKRPGESDFDRSGLLTTQVSIVRPEKHLKLQGDDYKKAAHNPG